MRNGSRKRYGMFLAGTALGAGAALLVTPQSGRKTRRLVRRQATDAGLYLVKTGRDISDLGHNIYEQSREFADDATRYVNRAAHRIA
jgi:gas vesicle protein